MLKNVQQFFGFNLEETDNDDDEDILDINFNSTNKPKEISQKLSTPSTKPLEQKNNTGPQQKQYHSEIKIASPVNYEESLAIASILREGTPIIVKCELLNAEDSKRLIDFLCGTAYAINGQMEKISDKIVIFSPDTTGLIPYENTLEPNTEKLNTVTSATTATPPTTQHYSPTPVQQTSTQQPYPQQTSQHPQTTYTGPTPTYNAEQVATPYATENEYPNYQTNPNSSLSNSW